jgi:hypothetical protein
MYLPEEILDARVLIAVKTYPRPTPSYEEIVCTAGLLESGKWIRIYPIPFRELPYEQQFNKYSWIQLDLRKSSSDARAESYEPRKMFGEKIRIVGKIDTAQGWRQRKLLVSKEIFSSMQDLISLAYGPTTRSLATLKPKEIIDLIIQAEDDREWETKYQAKLNQMKLFEGRKSRQIVRKLPYKYSYRFLSEGDKKPRKLAIYDWEIASLYWNCLKKCGGDEKQANILVKKKYMDEFLSKKDISFFLGTTYSHHKKRAPNPFSIIGVFYPPITAQPYLEI